MNKRDTLAWLIVVCALAARLGLTIWAGNAPQTPLTGGSDTLAYQYLADSLANHHGLSYVGMPTAHRPPLYPLFLAFGQTIAGGHYRIFIRLVQFLIGILLAIVCAQVSRKLGGSATVAFAAALAAPTLVFLSAELLTETLAALLVSIFFYVTIAEASPIWAGVVIGLGMLERFNLAALAVAYVVYQFAAKKPSEAARAVALAGVVAVVCVSPWFLRNLTVFHGQVLYSTHTGTNLLQGILTPDGRTQYGDSEKLEAAAGWTISDIETNSPHRTSLPEEPQLDRMAMKAAVNQLAHVNLFELMFRKLGYFWLSFDQMFRTQGMPVAQRFVRGVGILFYWLLLGIGIWGWFTIRLRFPNAALLFAVYALVVTALHFPFVINTRVRTPLIEPALAILVGAALAESAGRSGIGPESEYEIKRYAKG